jgi:hypothetical protein
MRHKRRDFGCPAPQSAGVCSLTGKQRYSRSGADAQARRMRRKYHEVFHGYRCQECNSWHVGGSLSNSHV